MQILKDPTTYGNSVVQLLPKRINDDRDGYKPSLIVAHIQVGYNNLYDDFNNRTTNLADCTVVNLRTGKLQRLLKDGTCPWTNGLLNKPNTANPVINLIINERIYPNNVCLTVEHQGVPADGFTNEQIEADCWLFAFWCQKYGIPADKNHIIGHNSFDNVSRSGCPGSSYPFAQIIQRVQKILFDAANNLLPAYRVEGYTSALNVSSMNLPPREPVTSMTRNGYVIGGGFYVRYKECGGLLMFGEPLTDEFDEVQPDGRKMTVQYFERYKFEYHPENPAPYDVLGARIGATALDSYLKK